MDQIGKLPPRVPAHTVSVSLESVKSRVSVIHRVAARHANGGQGSGSN